MNEEIAISFDSLIDMTGNNTETLLPLLQVIIKGLKSYPKEIDAAFMDGNHKEVARLAHKYKSSIAYLECPQFIEVLSVLENVANEGLSLEVVGKNVNKIEVYSEMVLEITIDKVASLMQ